MAQATGSSLSRCQFNKCAPLNPATLQFAVRGSKLMRSLGNLLDVGLAEAKPKRDSLAWIRQKAAEVAEQATPEDFGNLDCGQREGPPALTPRVRHLIDEAVALEIEQARRAGATGYIAHFLAQATLPHTDPKSNYFERGTGKLTLSITANPKHGVPYGGLPRLLLAWMCTEAVRTGSPELSLGRSQTEFLERLDLHNDGRYIARVHDQSLRLVRSLISVSGTDGDALGIENILIAKRAFIFWNNSNTEQPSLWDSSITLSTDFFESLCSSVLSCTPPSLNTASA